MSSIIDAFLSLSIPVKIVIIISHLLIGFIVAAIYSWLFQHLNPTVNTIITILFWAFWPVILPVLIAYYFLEKIFK